MRDCWTLYRLRAGYGHGKPEKASIVRVGLTVLSRSSMDRRGWDRSGEEVLIDRVREKVARS